MADRLAMLDVDMSWAMSFTLTAFDVVYVIFAVAAAAVEIMIYSNCVLHW